jgi:hypothetical protein
VVRFPRRGFQRLLPERPTPERRVEGHYLERTGFEGIAERKIRRRQLIENGNVEISGRDLRQAQIVDVRRASPKPLQSTHSGPSAMPALPPCLPLGPN